VLDLADQEVIQANMNKLAHRYKSLTYSDTAAIHRADKADLGDMYGPR
jgi:hypothetical protein